MVTLFQDPWIWLGIMTMIALFFWVRSLQQIRQLDRLRSRLQKEQEEVEKELKQLVEDNDA